jgi:hypothetical protein
MGKATVEWDDQKVLDHLYMMNQKMNTEIHQVLLEGVLEIELRAKHRAPKRYGFLRASIGHIDSGQISGSPKAFEKVPILEGVWIEKIMDIEMGSGLVYARKMEYDGGSHKEGQSPYLTPSMYEMVRPIRNGVAEAIGRLLTNA